MKITYKIVYPCWVIDEIERGHEVFVLDKSTRSVETVNDMTMRIAIGIIEAAENSKSGRYEFWYVKTEEEENVEEL